MRTLTIVRHEIFVTVRRKAYLFTTFGIPLLAAMAVGAFLLLRDKEEKPQNPLENLPDRPIGYVDHSGLFDDPGEFAAILIRFSDETSAVSALQAGELTSFYVIAADYIQTGKVTRKAPQLDFSGQDMQFFQAFLVSQLLGDASPYLLVRLVQPARMIEHQLNAAGTELSQVDEEERYGSNFILVYGFAMILLMSTFIPAGYLLRSVVEEKENRTIEVVLSSLRPLQLLSGKVLGQGIMGLLQAVIWLGSGWALFNLAAGEIVNLSRVNLSAYQLIIALLYFIGGFLLTACLQAGLGAISTNMREGPQYAAFFTLPMIVPLWLINVFIETPNSGLAVALSLIPITSPLGMIQRIAITAVPAWQLILSLILLALGVGVTLWLAAKISRVNTLLAGVLPKPAELLKLLREA